MSNIAGIPYDRSNKYINPFNGKVVAVGYKTSRMKKIKILKPDQYKISKGDLYITDLSIKWGTGDMIYIEV